MGLSATDSEPELARSSRIPASSTSRFQALLPPAGSPLLVMNAHAAANNPAGAVSRMVPKLQLDAPGSTPLLPSIREAAEPDWPSTQPFTPYAGDGAPPAHRRIIELLSPSHGVGTPELMDRVQRGLPSTGPAQVAVEMSPELMGAQELAGRQSGAYRATPHSDAPTPVQGHAAENPARHWHANGAQASQPDADGRRLQAWRLQMQAGSPEMGSEPHSPVSGASDEDAMQLVDSGDESDQASTPTHASDNVPLGKRIGRQPSSSPPASDMMQPVGTGRDSEQASTPNLAADTLESGISRQPASSPPASHSMHLHGSACESGVELGATHAADSVRMVKQRDRQLTRAPSAYDSMGLVDSGDEVLHQGGSTARADTGELHGHEVSPSTPPADDGMQLVESDDGSEAEAGRSCHMHTTPGTSSNSQGVDLAQKPQHAAASRDSQQQEQLQAASQQGLQRPADAANADQGRHQMVLKLTSSAGMSGGLLGSGIQGIMTPALVDARSAQPAVDVYEDEPASKLQEGCTASMTPTAPGFAFHGSRASRVPTPGR